MGEEPDFDFDINVTTRRCYARRLANMLRTHTGYRVRNCTLHGGQWMVTVDLPCGGIVGLPVSDLLSGRGLCREIQKASTA